MDQNDISGSETVAPRGEVYVVPEQGSTGLWDTQVSEYPGHC